ncbi:MAG TPA: hypothetical protein VED86_04925 [archaeon]|nr:hypothetical protein [archaeon]
MEEFLEKVNPKQKKYFMQLRSQLRNLPDVEETIEIDEISGEWCPVYRVKGSDLVWVHFDEHLWLNFPVEPKFEKKALQDENLESRMIECVKDAEETSGEKWATVELKSGDQVDQVLPLLELRHSVLTS